MTDIATGTAADVDPVTLRRRGVGLIAVDYSRCAGGYTLDLLQKSHERGTSK
ncbi:hypothetical protein LC653_32735 [Nostoc sp. CHAB 5784]|uniref:hypothetical protein n=1 Tax=Nostoc mirabile TaxID=2907820 RepID=UPI001E545679|nr:hypothetical protein [Nostoc mirabile]MCC5668488.1 hypothetical protein [Nostoc mirabile CHAB5784]